MSFSVEHFTDLKNSLDQDGYLIIPGVVSAPRLEQLRLELLEAYERFEKFKGGGTIAGHLNCFPGERARFIYEELDRYGLIDAIWAARPNLLRTLRVTTNFNLPGSVAQHFHMDGLFVENFVVCNVAIVDITVENGAMDALPGSHSTYVPYWEFALRRKSRFSTRLEMRQGDVMVRQSTLWHRGMPNRTASTRPMFSLTFGEQSGTSGDPFEGEPTFYNNWFTSSRIGIARERVVVRVPALYSAYRMAKSLSGKRGHSSY
jgi:hypothetical protein